MDNKRTVNMKCPLGQNEHHNTQWLKDVLQALLGSADMADVALDFLRGTLNKTAAEATLADSAELEDVMGRQLKATSGEMTLLVAPLRATDVDVYLKGLDVQDPIAKAGLFSDGSSWNIPPEGKSFVKPEDIPEELAD